jgi:hypothetical protein
MLSRSFPACVFESWGLEEGSGWYCVHRDTARVAWVRNVAAEEEEEEERSLPVGERRSRVCRVGVVWVERKRVKGRGRSIVCAIVCCRGGEVKNRWYMMVLQPWITVFVLCCGL